MNSKKGYLLLVLHAHLPFVRHPEYEDFLEERWLFEAITETYIPLIQIFDQFLAEQIPFRLTMSVTPTLASMLMDELLQERYVRHINLLIELTEKEIERTKNDGHLQLLARMYRDRFIHARHVFCDQYGRNLITAFRKFLDAGCLEIITCGSTHGFFPLMLPVEHSVRAQVKTACDHYERTFGRRPRGIWLPECGFYPGHDRFLKENGLEYCFVDTHGVLHARPRPKYGIFAPLESPNGIFVFGRDMESSKQVWSAHEGYPGDYDYREYYRDIGFDLDEDYIKPYIHPDGIRLSTGIKYHRITGPTNYKEYYNPGQAIDKAAEHAGNFMFNRERQMEHLFGLIKKKPVIVAPYDAELFGHWWHEGPQFLNFLIRKIIFDSPVVQLTTGPEYLGENPHNQPAEPSYSSWGYKGYAEFWLEGANDWIYPHLHQASEKMHELARKFEHPNELERRALNQAARELMLAESSDWAFIMKTGTVVEYAVKRTREHISNFFRLYEQLQRGNVDPVWLSDLESKDNLFPDITYTAYA